MLYSVITFKKRGRRTISHLGQFGQVPSLWRCESHKQKCCPFILFLLQHFCIANSWPSSLGYIYWFFSTWHFSQDMNRFFLKLWTLTSILQNVQIKPTHPVLGKRLQRKFTEIIQQFISKSVVLWILHYEFLLFILLSKTLNKITNLLKVLHIV